MLLVRTFVFLVCIGSGIVSASAAASLPKDLVTESERLVALARVARQRADFPVCATLLEQAEEATPPADAMIAHEQGLMLRDQNKLEESLVPLSRAADLDTTSEARVDQAGVLVQLGRWPEAVVVLNQAYDERSVGLPVQRLAVDPRFAKLSTLKPYNDLLNTMRSEQSGAIGRLLQRIENLQTSQRTTQAALQRLTDSTLSFRRRVEMPLLATLLLSLLSLIGGGGWRVWYKARRRTQSSALVQMTQLSLEIERMMTIFLKAPAAEQSAIARELQQKCQQLAERRTALAKQHSQKS